MKRQYAHAQLRINDSLNRAAVSADGATNNAATYGVSSSLFARGTGLKMTGAVKETEVLSFVYKHPSTDLVDEQAATNETNFYYIDYGSSPELKVFDKALDVTAVSGNTIVQDASGTLKVYINDPDNTINSTTFPTEVHKLENLTLQLQLLIILNIMELNFLFLVLAQMQMVTNF